MHKGERDGLVKTVDCAGCVKNIKGITVERENNSFFCLPKYRSNILSACLQHTELYWDAFP